MNEFSGTKRVGIIGAGIAGLAAAYDLTRQGCAVTIFEGAAVAGGLASGFKTARASCRGSLPTATSSA